MADYIGISKPLAVVRVTPKPEINYFYGPWENINEALNNIPQLARVRGLTVGIIEDSEIVEYWFKNGVDLVLKSVDPKLIYTTSEIQQIINDLENTYVQKEIGKELIPSTSLTKLNQLPTKESNDNTYVAKEVGKSLIEDSKIVKLDSLPNSVFSQAEIHQIITDLNTRLDTRIDTKVTAVPNQRLITKEEADKLFYAVTAQELANGLATKVTAVANRRLITEQEATKLASIVTANDLEPYSLKNTVDLEEIVEVSKEEKQYIKFFDELNGVEKKITLSNVILGASNPLYPTARALTGEKNGINEIFTSKYNYIAGSEKLNINGSIYYPNSGFYKEGNNIILSGAPIPEAGDFMFLEAVYLD